MFDLQPIQPASEIASPSEAHKVRRRVPIGGWPATIVLGLLSLIFVALFLWPLPTLDECTQVSGRISVVYADAIRTGRRNIDRTHFTLEGNERTFSYEETEPEYAQVKSQLRVRANAQVWFKSPPSFIFPLYSTELWRIDVNDRTIVDYDTIAAHAGRTKNGIALTGLFFFGLATIAMLRAMVKSAQA